jgi:hypothetical protein
MINLVNLGQLAARRDPPPKNFAGILPLLRRLRPEAHDWQASFFPGKFP